MPQRQHDFNFPRKTRLGALVLLSVLLVLIIVWKVFPSFIQPKPDKEESELQKSWARFKNENTSGGPSVNNIQRNKYDEREEEETEPAKPATAALFPFNPNTATEAELLQLGLPKYTVHTILKYRAKSSTTFKKKEDLQKLYTLSKADYERIEPYIRIPASGDTKSFERQVLPATVKAAVVIELNTATVEQLISLKGIGPGYSNRIIHYREALGGFRSVEQLKEVYGFPDSTYQQLKDRFSVNVTLVQQINVNIADEATLAKQVYIGRKMASGIVRLRKDMGQFKEIAQLRQVPLINEEKYRKIAPYLSTH
jgi:competence protein ComEA